MNHTNIEEIGLKTVLLSSRMTEVLYNLEPYLKTNAWINKSAIKIKMFFVRRGGKEVKGGAGGHNLNTITRAKNEEGWILFFFCFQY